MPKRRFDVFIVRVLPFILYLWSFLVVLLECLGVELDVHTLHGNSAIYALSLFLISLSDRKYHCVWNRAMYILLILLPVANYITTKIDNINVATYVGVVLTSFLVTAIATAYLAIKHFIKVNKKK